MRNVRVLRGSDDALGLVKASGVDLGELPGQVILEGGGHGGSAQYLVLSAESFALGNLAGFEEGKGEFPVDGGEAEQQDEAAPGEEARSSRSRRGR